MITRSLWKLKIQYLKILEYLHLSFIKSQSLQCKFWVSLVIWNHNNREDCWLGNGPEDNPDNLQKESQRVINERGAVQGVLYQSILNAKLTGRKKLGRKMCTSNRQAWEYSQAKQIQTLGRASQGVNWSWSQCIKSHHAQTSSGKGLPNHFWTRNIVRSILPGLWRKKNWTVARCSNVLFSD